MKECTPIVESLQEIQSLTKNIKDLHELLEKQNQRKIHILQQIDETKSELLKSKKELPQIKKQANKLEINSSEIENKLENLEKNIKLVTSEKELQALTNEKENFQKSREETLEKAIEELENIENLEKNIEEFQQKVEGLQKSQQEISNDIEIEKEKIQTDISYKKDRIQVLMEDLPLNLQEILQYLISKKNLWPFLASPKGMNCSMCGIRLENQVLQDLNHGNLQNTCFNCERLLIPQTK